jgi:hypothetical protein
MACISGRLNSILLWLPLIVVALLGLLPSRSPAEAAVRPPFRIHAFGGNVVRNGGKCLDYTSDVVGARILLNDCGVAHAIEVVELEPRTVDDITYKYDVHLRTPAGNVIGPLLPFVPSALNPGVPLELQRPTLAGTTRTVTPQTFSLDGDSIIWQRDRNMVVQVQNARGTNRTSIVLASRQLAASEFWEFRATDGSDTDPTSGFVRVSNITDLLKYLAPSGGAPPEQPATFGSVIKIQDSFEYAPPVIILSTEPLSTNACAPQSVFHALLVPAGVTIRGDRRGPRSGPQIRVDNRLTYPAGSGVFRTFGSDVRITNLRLSGPNHDPRSTDEVNQDDCHKSRGIVAQDWYWDETGLSRRRVDLVRTLIDHNDVGDWTWQAVQVLGDDPTSNDSCTQPGTENPQPESRGHNVWVARNFLHHNLVQNKGYGVNANSGAFPLIEGNTFVSNRHAIAGTNSTPATGYRALFNLVLDDVPLQHGIRYTHDFDMHGTGDNGFDGIAGGYVGLIGNTFLGTNRANFEVRGDPCRHIDVYNNIFLQPQVDAVVISDGGVFGCWTCWNNSVTAEFHIGWNPNQFDIHPNPTSALAVGDFDGDSRDDLFLPTGTAWYFSSGGEAEWRLLSEWRTDLRSKLLFGDFDGDGRTDVLGKNRNYLMVSWGGISEWEQFVRFDNPISELAVGDFNGDGRDDLFYADGRSWFVASGGSGPLLPVNTSGFRVANLRFGDFNKNGKTDVFGIVSGWWQFSDGATTAWTQLQPKLTDSVDKLVVGDFDGDNYDDIAINEPLGLADWKYSPAGVGTWLQLLGGNNVAGIGRFLGGAQSYLASWSENAFWIGPDRLSRQTMR